MTVIDLSNEDWDSWLSVSPWERRWFTDEEAAAETSISARNLRMLQALEYISTAKAKRKQGAQVRLWSTIEVLKGSMVAQLSETAGLSKMTTVALLKLIPEQIHDDLFEEAEQNAYNAIEEPDSWFTSDEVAKAHSGDLCIDIVNGRYVFLHGRWGDFDEYADHSKSQETLLMGEVDNLHVKNPQVTALSNQENKELFELHANAINLNRFNLDLVMRHCIQKAT